MNRRSIAATVGIAAAVLLCLSGPALAGGYRFTAAWGVAGTAPGELRSPKGVAVAADGSVFVADFGNHTMLKYSASGELLRVWGGYGSAPGEFDGPGRVAIGPDGSVYVADSFNQRVQRFSESGAFLGQWGHAGLGPGEFDHPRGVDVAADGSVYVTDQGNARVQVFTATGRFLRMWGGPGSGPGHFRWAKDVAVSGGGRVYVADGITDRVQIFTTRGRWLGSFGGSGSGRGRLSGPRGLSVGRGGHVFVADTMNYRIEEFTAGGRYVREVGVRGVLPGLFLRPRDVAEAPDGSLVVADTYNHRVQRFVRDTSGDDRAPVTRCEQRGLWYAAPVQLTFAARDVGSGVAATYVSVDGAGFQLAGATPPLQTQGRHVVRFLSVDGAGNQETARRRGISLDWTAPRVHLAPPSFVAGGATVRLRCRIADALSPSCELRVRLERDGTVVWDKAAGRTLVSPSGRSVGLSFPVPSSPGAYTVTVTARDRAGNAGTVTGHWRRAAGG